MLIRSSHVSPALTLLVALVADTLLGEPPAPLHPVVWIGKTIGALDARLPRRSVSGQLVSGGAMVAAVAGGAAGAAWAVARALGPLPWPLRVLALGLALKPAFAWKSLEEHVQRVLAPLEQDDLEGARRALSMIVSRPTTSLDTPRVTAGAIESLAENLSDSVVAPLFWYAVGGLPAAWAYRAANTMDAMVGYRTPRHEYTGKFAARLDDALNWLPARLTAVLLIACAPLAGASSAGARAIRARDAHLTASPNAGHPMAAMAGALGVELEKIGVYRLGHGLPLPEPAHLRRALTVARCAACAAMALALTVALAR